MTVVYFPESRKRLLRRVKEHQSVDIVSGIPLNIDVDLNTLIH